MSWRIRTAEIADLAAPAAEGDGKCLSALPVLIANGLSVSLTDYARRVVR